jgi:hypothetical protein
MAKPLLSASKIIAGMDVMSTRSIAFLRRGSKWQHHLDREDDGGRLEHCPVPLTETCEVILLQPTTTVNTGSAEDTREVETRRQPSKLKLENEAS